MTLGELERADLSKLSLDELKIAHVRTHQWWRDFGFDDGKERHELADGSVITPDALTKLHDRIADELIRRGLDHGSPLERRKALSTQTAPALVPEEVTKLPARESLEGFWENLPDILPLVGTFVSFVGSSVTGKGFDEETSDTDVVVRAPVPAAEFQFRIGRALQDAGVEQPQILLSPTGPHDDFIPLYDLVLRKVPKFEIQQMQKADSVKLFKPITPLKTGGGYGKLTFYSPEGILENFIKPALKAGTAIYVDIKYDGYRIQIHSDGEKVKIYSKKGKDISSQLPRIVETVKKIPHKVILDGEMILMKGSKQARREDLERFVAGEGPEDDKNVRVYVFDLLYLDGGDLHNRPLDERLKKLHSVVKPSAQLKFALTRRVTTLTQAKAAIEWARKHPLSEGAMVKLANSVYRLNGRTAAWAKLRNVITVHAEVISRKETGNNTYVYLAGYNKDGKILPLGETFATKEDARKGDILEVQVERINLYPNGKLTWVKPRVLGIAPDVDKADTYEELKEIATVVSEDTNKSTDLYMVKQPEKPLRFVIQRHTMGLWTPEERNVLRKILDKAQNGSEFMQLVKKARKDTGLALEFDYMLIGINAIRRMAVAEASDVATEINKHFLHNKVPSTLNKAHVVNRCRYHHDVRMELPTHDSLFGWTFVSKGSAVQTLDGDIQLLQGDELLDYEDAENIQAEKKKVGPNKLDDALIPISWLTVVTPQKPRWYRPPGTIGATERTAGLFEYVGSGQLVYGVQKTDAHEYFLKFADKALKRLSGRWLIRLVDIKGRDVWLANRPKEQRPYILTHNKEKEEAKARRDKIQIIWNENALDIIKTWGIIPMSKRGDNTNMEVEKKLDIRLVRKNSKRRIAEGPVLVPNVVDLQGDIVSEEEVEYAAHRFALNGAQLEFMHDYPLTPNDVAVVETGVLKDDTWIEGELYPKGTWWMAVYFPNERLWEAVEKGEINGFSIRGMAEAVEEVIEYAED